MRNRGRLVLSLSMLLAVGAVGGLLFAFSQAASADAPVEPPPESSEDIIGIEDDLQEAQPVHDPFSLYPDGVDALSYEELEQSEQEYADKAALWAESGNGHAVQSRYSTLARARANEAREKQDSQLAGTQGFDEIGAE